MKRRNYLLPSLLIFFILVIIIFIFTHVKQPYIECSKKSINNLNITVDENIIVNFNNDKISRINFNRRIILPNKYIDRKEYIKDMLIESYNYLDKSIYNISMGDNDILINGEVSDNETIILNNISFSEKNNLNIYIDPNTKSNDVVTLSIKDKYSEGEFITKMKNKGYTCK